MDKSPVSGFASAYLMKGRFRGYGVYVTDGRIIGVSKKTGLLAGQFLLLFAFMVPSFYFLLNIVTYGVAGLFYYFLLLIIALTSPSIFIYLVERWMKNWKVPPLEELERRKDFEFQRDQISQIEVKRPRIGEVRLLGSGKGHVVITLNTWKPVKLVIFGMSQYEKLKEMMKSFCENAPTIRLLDVY